MALKGIITKNTGDQWNAKKRYRVGALVEHNSKTYINLTGFNIDPEMTLVDWLLVEDNTVVPTRAIVFVNGNPFLLIKHPLNNSPSNAGIIENNDFITNGYFDNTTFWGKSQCIDDTDTDNVASWNVFDSIEELTLI